MELYVKMFFDFHILSFFSGFQTGFFKRTILPISQLQTQK